MATVNYTVFDGEIVEEDRGGTIRDYVPDPLGSTRALLDDTQTVTDAWSYWPYGEVNAHTGSSTTPFTFVGTIGYHKDATGLTYIRARSYGASTCNWLTLDTIWPYTKAYSYCLGSPCTLIDPTGLQIMGADAITSFLNWINGVSNDFGETGACLECLMKIYRYMGLEYPGLSGAPNAMRHCVGACEAVYRCGQACALLIIGHEIPTFLTSDSALDRCNNQHGFDVAAAGGDCVDRCECKLTNCELCVGTAGNTSGAGGNSGNGQDDHPIPIGIGNAPIVGGTYPRV